MLGIAGKPFPRTRFRETAMRVFLAHHHDTTKNAFSDLNFIPLCGTTNAYALQAITGLVKL